MALLLDRAKLEDVEELLKLYFSAYGSDYPLAIGSDREIMKKAITSPDDCVWFVTRDTAREAVVGSCVFEIERLSKIGRVEALVVNPEYRTRNLARVMVCEGAKELFSGRHDVNSMYATTRTLSIGPQLVFLRNGFMPLGIFPNSHKIKSYETLTLLARFKPGALERRAIVEQVPEKLVPIMKVMSDHLKIPAGAKAIPSRIVAQKDDLPFEFIFAPEYVRRKWYETFKDPYDRFYPFHVPNMLISAQDGTVELYAFFNAKDRYCTLISTNVPMSELEGRMGRFFEQLKDHGISYVETIIGLKYTQAIDSLISMQFLPSAIYPGMEESDGKLHDVVVLSRTMEPLNFTGMAIDESFKPYIDQYVELWKQMLLETIKVFNG